MGKNRRIPFGYMMQNGIITTTPAEVNVIKLTEYDKGTGVCL